MRDFKKLKKKFPDLMKLTIGNKVLSNSIFFSADPNGIICDTWEDNAWLVHEKIAKRIGINKIEKNGQHTFRIRDTDIICRIVGIIDTAIIKNSWSDDVIDDKTVFFEDILVLQPIAKNLQFMRIYVPQHLAGFTQKNRLVQMVGSIVSAKIFKVIEFNKEEKELSGYILLGDISKSEDEVPKRITAKIKREIKNKNSDYFNIRYGIVTNYIENGVFLLSEGLGKVFIPYNKLDYNYRRKREYRQLDRAELGSVIDFRIDKELAAEGQITKTFELSNEDLERGLQNQPNYLVGERLSFIQSPEDYITELCRLGAGQVVSGYIIDFNPKLGHFLEPIGASGYRIRVNPSSKVKKSFFTNKTKISVVITGEPSCEVVVNTEGNRYLRINVHSKFNTVFDDDDVYRELFDL